MVHVLHGAELAFEQDLLALFERLVQVQRGVCHVRADHLAVLEQGLEDLFRHECGLVIQVLDQGVLDDADVLYAFAQCLLIHEQLFDLEADLGVFVAVAGRDAALGGAERLACEACFFVAVQQDVIRHDDVRSVGDEQLRFGHALLHEAVDLFDQLRDVERDAVAQHAGGPLGEDARGEHVQGEFAVLVLDGVAGVAAALKTDDDIGVLRQHIGDLAFAFVAPVGADDRFNHVDSSCS